MSKFKQVKSEAAAKLSVYQLMEAVRKGKTLRLLVGDYIILADHEDIVVLNENLVIANTYVVEDKRESELEAAARHLAGHVGIFADAICLQPIELMGLEYRIL